MSVTTSGGNAAGGGALERGGATSGLADVVETVLDKGVVIDAQVTIGVVGIPLVEINARVVVASIETYLRFAERVDRLDISPKEGGPLSGLVGDVAGAAREVTSGLGDTVGGVTREVGGATRELGGATRELGGTARELGGTAGELGRTAGGTVDGATGRDRPRRRRDREG